MLIRGKEFDFEKLKGKIVATSNLSWAEAKNRYDVGSSIRLFQGVSIESLFICYMGDNRKEFLYVYHPLMGEVEKSIVTIGRAQVALTVLPECIGPVLRSAQNISPQANKLAIEDAVTEAFQIADEFLRRAGGGDA